MRTPTRLITISLIGVLCLSANPSTAQEAGEPNMAEFMKAMGAMMGGGEGGEAPALVDFRELRTLLPASLEGMKRTRSSAEKSGAMGLTVSFAEATYSSEDGGEIDLKIADNSGLGGLMGIAQQTWGMMEVDRETETGFERTAKYGTHKAQESYDNETKQGEIEILVGGRFAVEVSGRDVSWEAIQTAVRTIDLDKLATLKPKTPED